jgi:hypothetical protein
MFSTLNNIMNVNYKIVWINLQRFCFDRHCEGFELHVVPADERGPMFARSRIYASLRPGRQKSKRDDDILPRSRLKAGMTIVLMLTVRGGFEH